MSVWETLRDGFRAVHSLVNPLPREGFYAWLYDWQTLISGCLAMGAAVVVLFQVRLQAQQIRDERKRHDDSIKRQERRQRGRMVAVLSDISKFERNAFQAWIHGRLDQVTLDPRLAEILTEVSEWVDVETVVSIHQLINHLQIFKARHLTERKHSRVNDGMMAIDLGVLRVISDRLYDYARLESDEPVRYHAPTRVELEDALLKRAEVYRQRGSDRTDLESRLNEALDYRFPPMTSTGETAGQTVAN